jgi:hypothetical protein
MSRENFFRMQFYDGPYDGHVQTVGLPPGQLARVVALPVSAEIFRLLGGNRQPPHVPITSEALYQLEGSTDEPCYRFLRSVAPVGSHSHYQS